MKNVCKILLSVLTISMQGIGCKKDNGELTPDPHLPHSPTPPSLSDPNDNNNIPPHILVNYYILEVYTPKPESVSMVGPWDMVIAVNVHKDATRDMYYSAHNSYANHERYDNAIYYDSAKDRTFLKTTFNEYEFMRYNGDSIILLNSVPNMSYSMILTEHYTPTYRQLIRADHGDTYYGILKYQHLNPDSTKYFGFYDNLYMKRFMYKYDFAPTNPEISGSKWEYSKYSDFTWYGISDARIYKGYDFLVVPKGNGWRGENLDKDLLIVIQLQSRYKPINDPQFFYLLE